MSVRGLPADPLWLGAVALTLARALTAFPESMWAWGLNHGRFLGVPGWVLWALGALFLIPAAARPAARALAALGDAAGGRPAVAAAGGAAVAALLVGLVPDQLFHVGDFIARLGSLAAGLPADRVLPQALPLDLWLHVDLIRALMQRLSVDAYAAERLTGAVEAAALGALAVGFVRALGLTGTAGGTAALVVLCGGSLGLFAGYGKGLREMVLVTLAVGVFGTNLVRNDRGAVPLGLTMIFALLLHRSALLLLPALLTAWTLAGFLRPESQSLSSSSRRLAIGLPLVTLGVMSLRIGRIVATRDAVHLNPVGGAGSPIAAFLDPVHFVDVLNSVALLAPVALLLPLLAGRDIRAAEATPPGGREDRATGRFLAALLVPFLLLLLVAHPRQGHFRDWDVFAAAGMALSLVAAWTIGERLRGRGPDEAWIGATLAGLAVSALLSWLLLQHEVGPGLLRVAAYAREAPQRVTELRMSSWEFVGARNRRLRRLEAAADAYREAAAVAPIGRILAMQGLIEAERGEFAAARDAYRRLTEAMPALPDGWYGLSVAALQLGDRALAESAARRLLELAPGHPQALRILAGLAAETTPATPPAPAAPREDPANASR